MYHKTMTKTLMDGPKTYTYYNCGGYPRQRNSKCRNMIPADALEAHVNEHVVYVYGWLEIVERVVIPGSGHERELEQVAQDMRELTERNLAGELSDEDYDRELRELRAERDCIRELPAEPDRVEERPTGVKVWGRGCRRDSEGNDRTSGESVIRAGRYHAFSVSCLAM